MRIERWTPEKAAAFFFMWTWDAWGVKFGTIYDWSDFETTVQLTILCKS